MEFIHEHQDPDMGESSIVRDHDMRESSMVRDHDMVESSMVRDDNVENQIVVLPEDLQQPEQPGMFLLIVPVKKVLIYKNVPVNYVPINDVYNNLNV
ncbi:hypothetical protein Tco_1101893 [Tanacetum coccineum]